MGTEHWRESPDTCSCPAHHAEPGGSSGSGGRGRARAGLQRRRGGRTEHVRHTLLSGAGTTKPASACFAHIRPLIFSTNTSLGCVACVHLSLPCLTPPVRSPMDTNRRTSESQPSHPPPSRPASFSGTPCVLMELAERDRTPRSPPVLGALWSLRHSRPRPLDLVALAAPASLGPPTVRG